MIVDSFAANSLLQGKSRNCFRYLQTQDFFLRLHFSVTCSGMSKHQQDTVNHKKNNIDKLHDLKVHSWSDFTSERKIWSRTDRNLYRSAVEETPLNSLELNSPFYTSVLGQFKRWTLCGNPSKYFSKFSTGISSFNIGARTNLLPIFMLRPDWSNPWPNDVITWLVSSWAD